MHGSINEDKAIKRLAICLPETFHCEIKVWATKRNITMTQYVLEAVKWRLDQEVKD